MLRLGVMFGRRGLFDVSFDDFPHCFLDEIQDLASSFHPICAHSQRHSKGSFLGQINEDEVGRDDDRITLIVNIASHLTLN
jgi:hypothetical protein